MLTGESFDFYKTDYDTKQSGDKDPLMLEFWGMRSVPLLPSFPRPLRPGEVATSKVLSKSQIELFEI